MKRLVAFFNLDDRIRLNKPQNLLDITLKNICLDSRKVTQGDVFVAVKGSGFDGRDFIEKAIENGATAIVFEQFSENNNPLGISFELKYYHEKPVSFIGVKNLTPKLSALSVFFYSLSFDDFNLVGITGTNGKTTISNLIAQWGCLLGHKSALMGTVGNGFYGEIQEAVNTTGSPLEIVQNLKLFSQNHAKLVAMEVSSHGLSQFRVEALKFDVAVISNISRDHLDYHGDMPSYMAAKQRLFTQLDSKNSVINMDDPELQKLFNIINTKFKSQADYRCLQVSLDKNFIPSSRHWLKLMATKFVQNQHQLYFDSSFGSGYLTSSLIGKFNIINLLQAFASMLLLGYDFAKLCETSGALKGVFGRMEAFSNPQQNNKAMVIVDYAHTPDALEKALLAIREYCLERNTVDSKIYSIFGCGGNRDKGKRPLMAAVSEKFADFSIITDDNPRFEDPKAIVDDILVGFSADFKDKVCVIHSRKQALEYCLSHAGVNDIILLAGKGHEDYQIYGDKKSHASDRELSQELLGL